MYCETWEKVVKLVTPVIIEMKVVTVPCVLPILFDIYITIHLCPSKFSSGYMRFT